MFCYLILHDKMVQLQSKMVAMEFKLILLSVSTIFFSSFCQYIYIQHTCVSAVRKKENEGSSSETKKERKPSSGKDGAQN